MLRIEGQSTARFCDGASRRDFLQVGALGLGGMTLPQLLQAEAAKGVRRSHKAVIMVYLTGGPPHQDMFDLKPDAPKEIRGEFKPIATNVPGHTAAGAAHSSACFRGIAIAKPQHPHRICRC